MRVIAGSAKGIRLARVPAGVRPVSDRAREGLFSSLGPEVPGARVLDLFAGTGALGIEALSRGADRATFVDRARPALATLRENLARTGLANRAEVVAADVGGFLMRDGEPSVKFDLVLADPPYDLPGEQVEAAISALAGGWLEPRWVVALTRPSRSSTPVIPVDWHVSKRLGYGDTAVLIFRPDPREA